MTLSEIYTLFRESTGVSIDTRAINDGNIYFALKGENFDGNKFADQAIDKGASYAVIDNPDYQGDMTILVADALSCLQDLGRHHRMQLEIPFIGLTGSNGKTTTKELMAAALSTKYKVAFTKGNLNNHIGVPLTLLSIGDEHEIAIIEMGANHQREIAFLSDLCRPDYGYITNFGKAHLEGFGGVEGVIKGKSELYDFLRSADKKAFVNMDDPKQLEKSQGIASIGFGSETEVGYQVDLVEDASQTITVSSYGLEIKTQLTGQYNFSNVGAAIAVALHFGVDLEQIKEGIEGYNPTNNRSQVQNTDRNLLVVDAYNANPSSMEEALRNFREFPGESKWVILGDMFEMGEYEAQEHQNIADLAGEGGFEMVILVGQAFSKSTPKGNSTKQFETTEEVMEFLESEKPMHKTLLLKGSRGMRLEKLIDLL